MKVVRELAGRTLKFALGTLILSGCMVSQQAEAQSPYLLPYTIQNLAGGGTAPAVGAVCAGTNAIGAVALDTIGDGCPISSSSVVVGGTADVHDVGVDSQGNVYFLDNQSNGLIRRIDARSGVVSVFAGTAGSQPTVACAGVLDKYGDGCLANDGKANVIPASPATYQYTANLAKARGLSVGRNGDVYLADFSGNVVHRINLSTGQFSIVAGVLGGGTAAKPTLNVGQKGYTGDGGPATAGEVNSERGVAVDAAGNVYLADTANNVVRKVTASTGVISTVAGFFPGTAGFAGDGGPAAAALLSAPEDVEVDSSGNIYIADFGNSRVRIVYVGGTTAAKLIALTNAGTVATAGNIYTIMGGGAGVYTAGSIVPATSVPVAQTRKMALDARGNVYLYDNGNSVIFFLDATTGYMRTLAGTYGKTSGGASCTAHANAFGDNCVATNATLSPSSSGGVAVDMQGNLYITDTGDKELRKVNTNQSFATVASGSSVSQILQVHFAAGDSPAAVNPYVISGSADYTVGGSACTTNADTTQDCLVTIVFAPTKPGADIANLTVNSTMGGSSTFGISGVGSAAAVALDPGAAASFATALTLPQGIAQDASGAVYIADTGNNRVLRFTMAGVSTVIAGTGTAGYTGDNGLATNATLSGPKAVVVSRSGAIFIADTGNNVIRRIDPATGLISTYGGGASTICATAVDTFGDGCPATSATFSRPAGLAADLDGNIYVADTGNNIIRELTLGGYAVYVAGGATTACGSDIFGNGCGATGAIFNGPTGLALDAVRNLYVADTGNNEVREITNKGTVVLLAGTGVAGASGNGGPAIGAQLSGPTGVAVDAGANLYIADTGNSVIRLVNSLGLINSTVGTLGASGTGTLPGSAFAVQLTNPAGVITDGSGRLTVLDSGNGRAFTDDRGSVSYNFGRTTPATSSPTLQIQETSTGSVNATLGSPLFTLSGSTGSFTLSGTGSAGCSAPQTLAPGTSCLLAAVFSPTAIGAATATYTEANTNTINAPVPFITLSGTGAVLTKTSSATVLVGTAQYAVPFTVTTTVTPASCNTAAPSCFPTGTVTFFVDGTQVGLPSTVTATGTASASITGQSVGTHSVLAVYNGDGFYASSSASTLSVVIGPGSTVTVAVATPATTPQFTDLVLTANVAGPIKTSFPTGTVSFFAGSTLIGTTGVNPINGVATLKDVDVPANPAMNSPEIKPQSFGLPAGTYNLTAVYNGDANYAKSTSAGTSLAITPDAPSISILLQPAITGTAQGSTAQSLATILPSNTVNGTVSLSCSGMPANSVCTFTPTTLTFVAVPGTPVAQQLQVTLWTDVPPGVIPTAAAMAAPGLFVRSEHTSSLAGLLGWPVLITSLISMLGFRKQLRKSRLLAMLALVGLLTGGSMTLTGCSSKTTGTALTPTGVYNIKLNVTGPNGVSASTPITFTVTTGVAGQL